MKNALYKSTVLSAASLAGIAFIGMAPPAAAQINCEVTDTIVGNTITRTLTLLNSYPPKIITEQSTSFSNNAQCVLAVESTEWSDLSGWIALNFSNGYLEQFGCTTENTAVIGPLTKDSCPSDGSGGSGLGTGTGSGNNCSCVWDGRIVPTMPSPPLCSAGKAPPPIGTGPDWYKEGKSSCS